VKEGFVRRGREARVVELRCDDVGAGDRVARPVCRLGGQTVGVDAVQVAVAEQAAECGDTDDRADLLDGLQQARPGSGVTVGQ
jgi:hypothetical protein